MLSGRCEQPGSAMPAFSLRQSALACAYRGLSATAGASLSLVARGADWRERLAFGEIPGPGGGIWMHGASVGELASARVLIADLARDLPVLVTANSLTGRAAARDWGFVSCLAPFDAPGVLARFLARTRPAVQVTIENEIWPNRARLLDSAGIPRVVIGARMSERSARRWSGLQGLIRPVLRGIDTLSAQDTATEERLLGLGLRPEALVQRLQLKLLAPQAIIPGEGGAWRDVTVLAASTHEGEEEPVLDAWTTARAHVPDLRLILAPRHPARADGIAAMMAARGLDFARRSRGGDERAPLLLADTLGEMARWYERAAICVTGGSFADHGGHTPWEPAAHLCAILHGPHVSNFQADYAALDGAGASLQTDRAGLAGVIGTLVADTGLRNRMGQRARRLLDESAGDPGPLLDRIRAFVPRDTCT